MRVERRALLATGWRRLDGMNAAIKFESYSSARLAMSGQGCRLNIDCYVSAILPCIGDQLANRCLGEGFGVHHADGHTQSIGELNRRLVSPPATQIIPEPSGPAMSLQCSLQGRWQPFLAID